MGLHNVTSCVKATWGPGPPSVAGMDVTNGRFGLVETPDVLKQLVGNHEEHEVIDWAITHDGSVCMVD